MILYYKLDPSSYYNKKAVKTLGGEKIKLYKQDLPKKGISGWFSKSNKQEASASKKRANSLKEKATIPKGASVTKKSESTAKAIHI